jgi:hypothetical protein
MRNLLSIGACAVVVGCSTALPIPVAEFENDVAFNKAAARFHALARFRDFKGAQKALHAYAVLYQDEANNKRLLAQKLGETSFYSALGGVIAGIAKSPEGALIGGIGSGAAGILSDRYKLTVQAANYDLAAEAMRCMDRETNPFSEAGISGLRFIFGAESVSADLEIRDIAAKNFLIVQDRLQKLQANFVLGTPDFNKLRELAKTQPERVDRTAKTMTLSAPAALSLAARSANPALATATDAMQKAYEDEKKFVDEENAKGPHLEVKAEDYRARMAVCTAPISG